MKKILTTFFLWYLRTAARIQIAKIKPKIIATLGLREPEPRPDIMRVGEILRLAVPEFRGLVGQLKLTGPQQKGFALTGPEAAEIRVEGLLQAGAYRVSHPAKKTGRRRAGGIQPGAIERH